MDVFRLESVLTAAACTGARIAGLMVFAPFYGSTAIPARVKAGFTIVLTVLLSQVVPQPQIPGTVLGWSMVVASETTVGLLFGLAVQFVFDAAQLAGQVLGIQMGFSLVSILDPQTQADSPVLSIFHQMAVLLIFLQLDVHHWLLRGIVASFSYLPAGSVTLTSALVPSLLHAAGGIWLTGIQIAAPALAATVVADIALGFLGKASPQLPVLFFSLSVKSVLGMLVLVAGLTVWPGFFEKHFAQAIVYAEQVLKLARK